jgi:hypothetical protein
MIDTVRMWWIGRDTTTVMRSMPANWKPNSGGKPKKHLYPEFPSIVPIPDVDPHCGNWPT